MYDAISGRGLERGDPFPIDLTQVAGGVGSGPDLAAEASALRLPIGYWPNQLNVTGKSRTIRFQQIAVERDTRENELLSVTYAGGGFTLRVFND